MGAAATTLFCRRIKMLLERHKTNSIGARVTLSAGVGQVRRIFEHLTQEVGFRAVGFSPATANPSRLYSIGVSKMDSILGGFEDLALEYHDAAVQAPGTRFHECERHAKGIAFRFEQGLRLRRRFGIVGRGHGRRCQPLPPLCVIRLSGRWAMSRERASTTRRGRIF